VNVHLNISRSPQSRSQASAGFYGDTILLRWGSRIIEAHRRLSYSLALIEKM
jgi:hypothetical protein